MLPINYSFDTLKVYEGFDFGLSAPTLVDQQRINDFANCTGDDQWIHVDAVRAEQSMMGTTIAHGLLLLSLVPKVQFDLGVYPSDASGVLNYGYDKIRFLKPVPSGSKLVFHVRMSEVEEKSPSRKLVRCINTAYIDDGLSARGKTDDHDRPVMIVESLCLVYRDE